MYDTFNKESLGKRIKDLRSKRKKQYEESLNEPNNPFKRFSFCRTQALLAKELKVERRAVSGWENGTNAPSVENLVKLSNILECNIDYFFGANDYPDTFPPVALASHFSGISPDIIQYGIEHPDYLDCLNFFMRPDNCGSLFNDITLSVWRKFWIDASLAGIKHPFKDEVYKAYDEFSAITPINEVNKKNYSEFLKNKFPEDKLIIQTGKKSNGYVIKGCFEAIDYQYFFDNKKFNYTKFIKYLSDITFEPLSHNAIIESQKMRIAKFFTNLFTQYLKEKA